MAALPMLNRRIVQALLEVVLQQSRAHDRRLVLVHGRYDADGSGTVSDGHAGVEPARFSVQVADKQRQVLVTDQPSVLGVTQAWKSFQDSEPDGESILVVTTGVDDAELGWDVRGHAIGRATHTVDRVEIIAQRFGAVDADLRIRAEPWLVDALLEAEPSAGWHRVGSVLTRDAAMRELVRARIGEETLDADALLAWSETAAGPSRFAELPLAERDGITRWLTETVGGAAPVLMGLAAAGRAGDAMALGLIGAVVAGPGGSAEAALTYGGLLAGINPRPAQLRAFTDAVEGTLERWIVQAESGGVHASTALHRVLGVVKRADEIAADADLLGALEDNRFLESGLQTRLRTLAQVLNAGPVLDASGVTAAEAALRAVRDHRLARLYQDRLVTAEMAVRLVRWLSTIDSRGAARDNELRVSSVAVGVRGHLTDWGWVDRGAAVLWVGDATSDPMLAAAYGRVYDEVRARRDQLDESFARRLAVWTTHASTLAAGGALLVEDVLATVVAPLAASVGAPLVIVLDGMSSAVAVELAEWLTARSWIEVSAQEGVRSAAVSAVPSVTRVSRASLLTGALTTGGQQVEREGFTAFWRKHRRQAALFHKGGIAGNAGQRLGDPLLAALADNSVVGVVLNTVDDALDRGRARSTWTPADIGYLPELLDAAQGAGRPVVLVADHGHVLDRRVSGQGPTVASGVESARWRVGTEGDGGAAEGEIELAGPRVREGGGRVIVPWREDIHYTRSREGYHGGASLAEMTVPVLTLLPPGTPLRLPAGWAVLPPEASTPRWWTGHRPDQEWAAAAAHGTAVVSEAHGAQKGRRKRSTPVPPTDDTAALFALDEVPAASARTTESDEARVAPAKTVGEQVVASEVYANQRRFVKRAPDAATVAAVIDALVAADDRLSLAAVAARAQRAARSPEGFVATLERLLNVEGYPVMSTEDDGRTVCLDPALLSEQFGVRIR